MEDLLLEPDGHPFINGCFNWMILNLYKKNVCFTKHPLKKICFWLQVGLIVTLTLRSSKWTLCLGM